MNSQHGFADEHDRLTQLLADRALQGLDERELEELLALVDADTSIDLDHDPGRFEQASAQAAVAMIDAAEALPASLRDRLVRSGRAWLHDRGASSDSTSSASLRISEASRHASAIARSSTVTRFQLWGGWMAAAACLLLALLAWLPRLTSSPALSAAELRADMLAHRPADLVQWTWVNPTDDPSAKGLTGDIVWSDAEQKGFMRFKGLAKNDPTREQYQLWIFDANRKADYPVDGGVFDVTSDGEVIIPIDPKLHVFDANMFAVTVEKPGGVARSDRERIPALAQPPK